VGVGSSFVGNVFGSFVGVFLESVWKKSKYQREEQLLDTKVFHNRGHRLQLVIARANKRRPLVLSRSLF
jgi:hypothetical protein